MRQGEYSLPRLMPHKGDSVIEARRILARQMAGAAGGRGAMDPIGGITLFFALEKQMGLRLENTNIRVSAIVLDHIEEKPTDH